MSIDPRDKVFSDIHKKVFGIGGNEMRNFKLTGSMLIDLYNTGRTINLADDVVIMKVNDATLKNIVYFDLQISMKSELYSKLLCAIDKDSVHSYLDVLTKFKETNEDRSLFKVLRERFDINIEVKLEEKEIVTVCMNNAAICSIISNVIFAYKKASQYGYPVTSSRLFEMNVFPDTSDKFNMSVSVNANERSADVTFTFKGNKAIHIPITIEYDGSYSYNTIDKLLVTEVVNIDLEDIARSLSNVSDKYIYRIWWSGVDSIEVTKMNEAKE